jgi:hypothetical protein
MSDVLGARVGSDDPERIAEARNAAPKILGIGPSQQPRQNRRREPVLSTTSEVFSRAVTRERCRRRSWWRWGT